jgi:endonuclease YncB( thermonuclease family)
MDREALKVLPNRNQVKARLAEIDCPEKGQPWGNKAKQAL